MHPSDDAPRSRAVSPSESAGERRRNAPCPPPESKRRQDFSTLPGNTTLFTPTVTGLG